MKSSKDTIQLLVEKFKHNLNEYKNPGYNETHIRVEFVNPFWEALGWDVQNKSGYAMSYRDVIHEDEVKVGGTTKAPDYSFRIGGRRIFFLETKKLSIDLKHNPAPAFQLRRYAYSAGRAREKVRSPGHLSGRGRPVVSHHRRKEADFAKQHLRRGY